MNKKDFDHLRPGDVICVCSRGKEGCMPEGYACTVEDVGGSLQVLCKVGNHTLNQLTPEEWVLVSEASTPITPEEALSARPMPSVDELARFMKVDP